MSTRDRAGSPPVGLSWEVVEAIAIDPDVCSFLADHQVAGAPLLPTVLQLDLIAGAVRHLLADAAGLRMVAIVVGAPIRFPDGSPRSLLVVARPSGDSDGIDVELRSPDGSVHLQATLSPVREAIAVDAAPAVVDLPGTADLVYPPMFHGPAFQVLRRYGRDGTTLVSEPADAAAAWVIPGHGGVLPVQLLELVLQSCGVWELAETGTMMRPSHIDDLVVAVEASPTTTTNAATTQPTDQVRITPRPGAGPEARVFDGAAVDAAGRTVLQLQGYRPVVLGVPASLEVARRITRAIGASTGPHATDASRALDASEAFDARQASDAVADSATRTVPTTVPTTSSANPTTSTSGGSR